MRNETARHDITVVGGGLAGVCAAIAAARLGRSVALINNRPVLGGNASSEVRVWVCGATGHGKNHHAREGGIMGELLVENQFRNPDGNPYYWDAVVLDAVRAEPGITLYLNTDVREVDAEGPDEARRITSVTGWMMGSERRIRFESSVFLDCTGDGLIGHLAGAHHRIGRESRAEYDEPWAPETADDITLGSTLLFYTKDAGHPVKFVPPDFAKDITRTSIPQRRIIKAGDNGCAYWWIEFGGELDTVHDNERIRDELWSVVHGIWDHIKNSGEFDAANMTLEWVGSIPGKREYRRFLGDYVLHQGDILGQTEFADRVAFGGWSIDLHPPQGMYATEAGAKQLYADGIYHIPYRSLYSVNTENLLFAGRNISASHVAFGSTRVMATCATIGQAAGTAAALCAAGDVTPRELPVPTLHRALLHEDASLIGLASTDPEDLALRATATASSTLRSLVVEDSDEPWPLAADAGLVLPADPELAGVELLVDADRDTELVIDLYDPELGQNYVPRKLVATTTLPVPMRRPAVAQDRPGLVSRDPAQRLPGRPRQRRRRPAPLRPPDTRRPVLHPRPAAPDGRIATAAARVDGQRAAAPHLLLPYGRDRRLLPRQGHRRLRPPVRGTAHVGLRTTDGRPGSVAGAGLARTGHPGPDRGRRRRRRQRGPDQSAPPPHPLRHPPHPPSRLPRRGAGS